MTQPQHNQNNTKTKPTQTRNKTKTTPTQNQTETKTKRKLRQTKQSNPKQNQSMFSYDFGLCWDHFGTIVGSWLDVLGSFGNHFEPFLNHFRNIF